MAHSWAKLLTRSKISQKAVLFKNELLSCNDSASWLLFYYDVNINNPLTNKLQVHYKKLKRQQFNNSWNTPLQSGVEQREVPQSDGLSAKIHKHKVVAPLSMDSAKVPREPFSTVLGMDLARSLHPCYLSHYPKTLMTYLSRNPFFFYDTAFCLEKYISPHHDGRMMLLLLSIALEAKNLFEIQFQDLLLQPLSFLYPDIISFSDFESFFFLYCDAIVNKGVLQFDRLCMAYICG